MPRISSLEGILSELIDEIPSNRGERNVGEASYLIRSAFDEAKSGSRATVATPDAR
jgi:hypothetical protein